MLKLFKNVKGMKATKNDVFTDYRFDVRVQFDEIGRSLSITDNKKQTMFLIPITEEMLNTLLTGY